MHALFVRATHSPARDLRVQASAPWGEPQARHAGLSGYQATPDGAALDETTWADLEAARARVERYFRAHTGGLPDGLGLVIYEGERVGGGPDGEDLFQATRLVARLA